MKIAYFDCLSGIAGDMTVAALVDAGASLPKIQDTLISMGISQVKLHAKNTQKSGFRANQLFVEFPQEHAHRHLSDILRLIEQGKMSHRAKEIAKQLFECIGRAEAKVHGVPVESIHFHEVGALDSIADIVGVAVAWDELGIEAAFCSPIPVGFGSIEIAHGRVSLPAPATAEILLGIPLAACEIPKEMTTPTGAAIARVLSSSFGPVPAMTIDRIGYGAGSADFADRPNVLRILIGSFDSNTLAHATSEMVSVLETNVDDVSGEQIGFVVEQLAQAGALDVFTSPCQMKKNRPGHAITVLCRPLDASKLKDILFVHLGTLGLRERIQSRSVLRRRQVDISTPWGIVRAKESQLPSGQMECSPEFDDCRQIAIEHSLRLQDVIAKTLDCYRHHDHGHHDHGHHDHGHHDHGHHDHGHHDHGHGPSRT